MLRLAPLVLAGCSFIATSRPKPPPQDPSCTTSLAPALVDTFLTINAVIGVLTARGGGLFPRDQALEVGFGAAGAVTATSAIVGFILSDTCQRAYDDQARQAAR